jgi:hypothetical protein
MSVNNGRRVDVALPGYSGQAGLVEYPDRDAISFPAGQGGAQVAIGADIMVDGRPRTVTSVSSSPFLRNFKVLELRK